MLLLIYHCIIANIKPLKLCHISYYSNLENLITIIIIISTPKYIKTHLKKENADHQSFI